MVYIGYTKYDWKTGERYDCYLTWEKDKNYEVDYSYEARLPWVQRKSKSIDLTEFKCYKVYDKRLENNTLFSITKIPSKDERYAIRNVDDCYLFMRRKADPEADPEDRHIKNGQFRCNVETYDTFDIMQEVSNPYQIVYRAGDQPCVFSQLVGKGVFICGEELSPRRGTDNFGDQFWIKEGENYVYSQSSFLNILVDTHTFSR